MYDCPAQELESCAFLLPGSPETLWDLNAKNNLVRSEILTFIFS